MQWPHHLQTHTTHIPQCIQISVRLQTRNCDHFSPLKHHQTPIRGRLVFVLVFSPSTVSLASAGCQHRAHATENKRRLLPMNATLRTHWNFGFHWGKLYISVDCFENMFSSLLLLVFFLLLLQRNRGTWSRKVSDSTKRNISLSIYLLNMISFLSLLAFLRDAELSYSERSWLKFRLVLERGHRVTSKETRSSCQGRSVASKSLFIRE